MVGQLLITTGFLMVTTVHWQHASTLCIYDILKGMLLLSEMCINKGHLNMYLTTPYKDSYEFFSNGCYSA